MSLKPPIDPTTAAPGVLEALDVRVDALEAGSVGSLYSVNAQGAIPNDSSTAAKAANVTAFNAAIVLANTATGLVTAEAGTYYFTAGTTLTTMGINGARGMVGSGGLVTLEFNTNGNCLITKGDFKVLHNLYVVNRSTTHSATDAVIRIKNCGYGDFRNLFTAVGTAGTPRAIMLEQEYDGSAADANFIVHLGCWYNRFDNVTCIYLASGEDIGYGLSFEVAASAVSVVNPPGEPAGTYTGSIAHNVVAGFNIEGKLRGLNLDRATGNLFLGGQFLGSASQVAGRNTSNFNVFDRVSFNQPTTQIFDLDSSCFDNQVVNPSFQPNTASLGNMGMRTGWDSPKWSVGGSAPAVAWATNWGNAAGYEGAYYYKRGQKVHLVGVATKTAAISDGETILTLPAEMRPSGTLDFSTMLEKSATWAAGRVRVNSAGVVAWLGGVGVSGDKAILSGISFHAT